MEKIEENEPSVSSFKFSYYENLWSKKPIITTLKEHYRQTTGPLWKPRTECYRNLKGQPGREKEAKMIKESMPAVIVEGVCRPNSSHAAANLEQMSKLAMFDLDNSDTRTEAIKELFRHLPYVAMAHTSISGKGLKVIVYLDARTPQEYPLAYAICRQTLERIAGHPCDLQCCPITQPCSCVWDPQAYYNAAPLPYPWREELATDPSLARLIRTSPNDSGSGAGYMYMPCSPASPLAPATEGCGYIEMFIRTFFHYHNCQKGSRHSSMLALGRAAIRKGFSIEELEILTKKVAVTIVSDSYTLSELRRDLLSGYQYINKSNSPQEKGDLLTPLTTDTLMPDSTGDPQEEKEILSINNETLRASSPCIPVEVFDHLPAFLNEALKPARNKRERDILLLGVLANLSGCMPNVRITFDQRPFSPHLYLLVIAPPASGKGLLSLAAILPETVNNYLRAENKKKKTAYERELKSNPNNPPEEPEYYQLCGAPNTSKNQIISRLKTNGDLGLIINATELDMISGAIKQDYGKHDDVFRAAFHHESVSTDFKVDKQLICAETPRLALCLSGTPNQLPAFVHSIENGLYSRFIFYTNEADWKYRSAAPIQGQEDYISLYKRLSKEVLDKFLFLNQSPTEVTLTQKQWIEHTEVFTRLLNEVTSEKPDAPGSIILRGALIVARIASILTALRKCEESMEMKERTCTDEDFHTAMQIVKTTLNHSLLLESSLPGDEVKMKPLRKYFKLRSLLHGLNSTFTYKEAVEKALTLKISERTFCRYLNQMIESQCIEKQVYGYKKLKEFTDK